MTQESWKKAQSIIGVSPGRQIADFYPTPPIAVTQLLASQSPFPDDVWECAAGDGAISRVLESRGYRVTSTDLFDYGFGIHGVDFLSTRQSDGYPKTIITNPPFKLLEKFIAHALFDLESERVCFLAKLATLEGKTRSRLLEKTPLKRVLVFRSRLTLTRGGAAPRSSGMIAFAWFVWERGYTDSPTVGWLP